MHAPSYPRNPRIKLNLQSGEKQQYGIAKTENEPIINSMMQKLIAYLLRIFFIRYYLQWNIRADDYQIVCFLHELDKRQIREIND
jgi:hypothetical protein